MNKYIIPIVVLFIIVYGCKNKVSIYDSFMEGAREGLHSILTIIPPIFGLVLAVNIFIESGIIGSLFNDNSELVAMSILRPMSGNASLAMLSTIYNKYGVDSFNGILASLIQGANDTTIYILALYFSSIKVKKTRYALFIGLFADICGVIAAYIVVKLFF
ncbi:MAG: spore maturation protein [Candidatus Coprovivens sp.]